MSSVRGGLTDCEPYPQPSTAHDRPPPQAAPARYRAVRLGPASDQPVTLWRHERHLTSLSVTALPTASQLGYDVRRLARVAHLCWLGVRLLLSTS